MTHADEGGQQARVVKRDMLTDPTANNLFTHPIRQTSSPAGVTIVAEYATPEGVALTTVEGHPSAGIMTYLGPDGLEEMHVFFALAWFDLGSWAWMHYINEWGTKGIFMGERRFYLAGMVDDLFLATGVFEYDGEYNEGAEQRATAANMQAFKEAEDSLNAQYGSSIVTEFPFNGLGILEKVDSAYVLDLDDADIALLPKGEKVTGTVRWGLCLHQDGVLEAVSNLSRIGQRASRRVRLHHRGRPSSYNWRSMTNPGITGLFNKYCLQNCRTLQQNLMTCAPGDNTYDGVQTTVSLVSDISPYHSIYTTADVNGYDGFQIVPRFATNVYFNCVTADCLVKENEWIRRVVCNCEQLDPSIDDSGGCDSCGGDIQSFGSTDALFTTEARTTSRYILAGHRDKYMFHQANVIPASDLPGSTSLLAYWYQVVMEELSSLLAFPVTSKKFDDLCTEFTLHETLDHSQAYLTADISTETGEITGLTLNTGSGRSAGFIPLTVPITVNVPTGTLIVGSTERYGSDKTVYLATSADLIPTAATIPEASELAAY
eukprot:jgi/Undpi1/12790/HiC_scaffold_7.g02457.m1